MTWKLSYYVDWSRPAHVHPIDDVIDHDIDSDGNCICGPVADLIQSDGKPDASQFIHNSLDGREASE